MTRSEDLMQMSYAAKRQGPPTAMHRRRRRKPLDLPPGHPSEAELIAAFIAKNGITRCRPGYAMGSLASSAEGLDA